MQLIVRFDNDTREYINADLSMSMYMLNLLKLPSQWNVQFSDIYKKKVSFTAVSEMPQ